MNNRLARSRRTLMLTLTGLFASLACACQTAPRADLSQRLAEVERSRLAEVKTASANGASDHRSTHPQLDRAGYALPAGRKPTVVLASYSEFLRENRTAGDAAGSEEIIRGPLPGFRETLKRDIKRWLPELWDDTKSVYTDPGNLVILLGAAGAAIAANQDADDDIADHFKSENLFGNEARDTLSFVGGPATHFALAGLWYAVGIVKQDDKTYEVGRKLIDALTITGASTMLIKVAGGRKGPNGEWGAFPSGHTSSSVTFAAVMHEAYGPWVGVPLYGLSTLVALERLDDGEHYLSDVIFGAAMGWVVGHTVATGHRPELFGGEIAPYVNPETQLSGIAWTKSFK